MALPGTSPLEYVILLLLISVFKLNPEVAVIKIVVNFSNVAFANLAQSALIIILL